MLAVVSVLCLVLVGSAEASAYDLKCSEYESANATMRPFFENVYDGRYTIQVCVEMKPNVVKWVLDLMYREPNRYCRKPLPGRSPGKPGATHTTFIADSIADRLQSLNCTNVCLTTQTLYIFRSCYLLKSVLHTKHTEYAPYDSYFNITNNYTLNEFNATPNVAITNHENDTTIRFYIQVQPDTYKVTVLNHNISLDEDVTNNCTSNQELLYVECSVSAVAGCFDIWLDNNSPWAGAFSAQRRLRKGWCRAEGEGVDAAAGGVAGGALWACSGVVLALAAAALLWRYRDHRHLHKRVIRYWTQYSSRTTSAEHAAVEAGAGAGTVTVLLLYARECELGQKLVAALRELLLEQPHVQVLELYSPECVRAGGAAPHAWLQQCVRAHRVLVLQTPALAALYTPRHQDPSTCEPLLGRGVGGRGVMYRAPHFGDTLLQYALRIIDDDACNPLAYKKYYLATLTALPTELFPVVVPFRRYSLPGAAAVLARDVCALTPTLTLHAQQAPALLTPTLPAPPALHTLDNTPTPALLQLQHAAEQFVTYVHDNPDYLIGELLIT